MKNKVSIIYKYHVLQIILNKILYGKHYYNRYKQLINVIPFGASVVDICSGDCNLFHFVLRGRNKYTGVDINASRLVKNKNVKQKRLNIIDEPLPKADIVVMQGSLYQFRLLEKKVIDKMMDAAGELVIISEPIINLANSENKIISYLAKRMVNPGTGNISNRFTKHSIKSFFKENYKNELEKSFLIAGGRDMVFVLNPNRQIERNTIQPS